MKNIVRLCFLFCVIMFPYMASAHAACDKIFKIKQFAGDWILSSSSVGGIGVNSGPGISSAVLRHVTFDKNGNGTENNGTLLFYLADGTLDKFIGVSGESIKLTLTDPATGAGSIAITDNSTFQGTTVYNFIAKRTKHGKINKLFLILVGELGNKLVVTGVLERQNEE